MGLICKQCSKKSGFCNSKDTCGGCMAVWMKEKKRKQENRDKQKKKDRDKQDETKMSVRPTGRSSEILAAELDRIGLYYTLRSSVSVRQMILGEFHCLYRAADEGECVSLLHFTAVKPK
jgi:hypothetical protein